MTTPREYPAGLAFSGAPDPNRGGGAVTAPRLSTARLAPRTAGVRLPVGLTRDRALVAGLVGLAALLRVPTIGRAYWIDEGISVGIASHPLSQLPPLLRHDGSPPLFYVLLHFWMRLFGPSEPATHLLPLLISLAAIPTGYWAGRELFDRRAGLAAAALMATNPFLNWYSSETRMYTLIVLEATVGVTLAWRAIRDRRPADGVGAVGAYTALLYTHDWAIYLTVVSAAVLFWVARARGDRMLGRWVLAGAGAAFALWLPWLPSFLFQAGNTAAPWAVRPGIGDFFADPAAVLAGTLAVVIVPLLVFGVWRNRLLLPGPTARVAGVLGAVAILTTVVGFLGAELEPSWTARYLAVVVAPYVLAAAGALTPTRPGRVVVAVACSALAFGALIGILLPNPNSHYAKDNLAAVAAAARPHLQPGDLVVVNQTEQVPVAHYYLPPGLFYLTPTGPVRDPTVVDWRDIVHRLQQASPCTDLSPTLDALPVGADVLEIDPVRHLGASGSAWSRAVNRQVYAVDQFLTEDPALKAVGVYSDGLHPKPYAAVAGIMFEKTSATPSCA